MKPKSPSLNNKIKESIKLLGLDYSTIKHRNLPQHEDADQLVVADYSASGRAHELIPSAAESWQKLKASAIDDNISLIIISAFRSFDRQFEIIKARLDSAEPAEELLKTLAPPGCSEHHTGRALDIGTLGCEPASEDFALTQAFEWLHEHASKFGYTMSYPKDNKYGFCYEPWHWCHTDQDI